MKKVLLLFIIPYMFVIGVIFYIYFGPGVITGYETLKWKGIETMVPVSSKVQIYQSKGWDVYSLRKAVVFIKIALKPAMDVSGLAGYGQKVLYKVSGGPGEIYYIANPRKTMEVVYARTMEGGDTTIYFSVTSPSLFSGLYIMNKISGHCFYKGEKITSAASSSHAIPMRCYITDYIFVGSVLLPLIIIMLLFALSGKKPSAGHFSGDPIRCEESYIYYAMIRRFRRKGNFGYLALTASGRLRMFIFMRPIWSIDLHDAKSALEIEGNKIILQKENEKIVFYSAKIREWQEALGMFSY